MINFNDILRNEGIDPANVRLVRHQDDASLRKSKTLFEIWKQEPEKFEVYQSIQSKKKFHSGELLASFVVTPRPSNETLFIGLYSVEGIGTAPEGTRDPVSFRDASGSFLYDLKPDPRLDEYKLRLRIDWGLGARAWVQLATGSEKKIIALRDEENRPFPGFDQLTIGLEDFPTLPGEWVSHLKKNKGIYLIVNRSNGKQYVGSAIGEDSIWQRWSEYFKNGHGGNKKMREELSRDYQLSVLHAVPLMTSDTNIAAMEENWKRKLLSRQFGLNAN